VAETVQADIENAPWPLAGRQFGGVVVTHYLWRDVWPHILESLRPGGVLIYETFSAGNETVGKPSRPDFLLRTAELLTLCQGLRVVAFEDGFLTSPESFIQRIVAVREPLQSTGSARYPLSTV
jgi:SAM-dependent methyltransferase